MMMVVTVMAVALHLFKMLRAERRGVNRNLSRTAQLAGATDGASGCCNSTTMRW